MRIEEKNILEAWDQGRSQDISQGGNHNILYLFYHYIFFFFPYISAILLTFEFKLQGKIKYYFCQSKKKANKSRF